MINKIHNPPINNSINNLKENQRTIETSNQETIDTSPDNSLINDNSIQDNIIQIKINKIMEKLQKLEITNKELLYKILDRLTLNKQQTFLNELESLLDILSSKDIQKKLHPKVVTAIENSRIYIPVIINEEIIRDENNNLKCKETQEFKSLEDFRNKLLYDLLNALSDPNRISQEKKGTCAQTVIERSIAERNPAQYIKIITELITQGYYTAPNGQKVPLNNGGIRKIKNEIDDRLLCTRIITPSFMEFYYDKDPNIDDYNDDIDEPYSSYAHKTASAIYNAKYIRIDISSLDPTKKAEILKELLEFSADCYPTFISYINYKYALHAVELKNINIEDNSIVISDPKGKIETYTLNSLEVKTSQNFTKDYNKNYNKFIQNIYFATIPVLPFYVIITSFPDLPIRITNY